MAGLFWASLWAALAVLVILAGVRVRQRKRERLGSGVPMVDDEAIEAIMRTGTLHVDEPRPQWPPVVLEVDDEPLDQEEIDDEEERFWSESWDEPTEW